MSASWRVKLLALAYVLLFAAAAVMAALEVLGLLPLLIIIAAVGGLLHLAYVTFFARLPDYLSELKDRSGRPPGRS